MRRPPGGGARRAAIVVLAGSLLLAAPATGAQHRGAKPSASHLWEEYPLQQRPAPDADGTAVPEPVTATPVASVSRPTPTQTATPAATESSGPAAPFVLVACTLLLVVGVLVALRRRSRTSDGGASRGGLAESLPLATHLAPPAAGPHPAPEAAEPPLEVPDGEAPWERQPPRGALVPPAPDRQWTAEVDWEQTEASSCFRAVASLPDGAAHVTVAESAPLEWPPQGPESLQALRRAADDLEASLLAAGWQPLPAGDAWYAKRFAWEPVAAPAPEIPDEPAPEVPDEPVLRPARRFTPRGGWPEETDGLWRCELEWHAGLVTSRFEAVVREPSAERGQAIGASHGFRLQLGREPDPDAPEYRDELERLTGALTAAGWEQVAAGPHWYSRRFVWRGEGRPPDRLEEAWSPTTASPPRS